MATESTYRVAVIIPEEEGGDPVLALEDGQGLPEPESEWELYTARGITEKQIEKSLGFQWTSETSEACWLDPAACERALAKLGPISGKERKLARRILEACDHLDSDHLETIVEHLKSMDPDATTDHVSQVAAAQIVVLHIVGLRAAVKAGGGLLTTIE